MVTELKVMTCESVAGAETADMQFITTGLISARNVILAAPNVHY